MKRHSHLLNFIVVIVSTLIPSAVFAGLNNMSVKTMVKTYYTTEAFDNFVGGTAFSLENNDESTEYDNFLFSEIFRRNASLSFNGYGEGSNGNFNNAGTEARQYAVVSNPKNLNSALVEKTDGVNRLVFHSAKQNAEFLTINISGYKLNTAFKVRFTVEEVTGKSGANASWQVSNKKGEALGSAITIGGVIKIKQVTIDVPADKATEPDFTIVIKNNSANGANFVFAISRFAVFGTPDVPMSGVVISATDGGKELGCSVALSAIISEDGVTCDNIKWQRKEPVADWSDMTQTGCDVKDIPIYAGKTGYRVQYTAATGETKYSNVVEVKRISKCDGKASNNLFFEDFGVLQDEKDHATCSDVPSYSFAPSCYPVKDGGQYAVVATGTWAGYGDIKKDEKKACDIESKGKSWFREDLISHDGNKLGGMLLLNCQDGDKTDDVLYKRKVDLSCENTTVTFTFYIAQASKEASDPIKLLVELLNDNGEQVDDPVEIEDQLLPGADWKEFTMQFNTGTDKSVTIKVTNKAKAGAHGNDIFLDDLSFSICVPEAELNHKSGGVKRGKQVKADCGTNVVLEVDAAATAGIANPFYYWVVSENGGEYKYVSSMSGEKKNNTFVPLEDKSFSTFVILAPSESVADKYFKGEGTDCQPVSATDTITVTCSIPSLTYKRECNDINFIAQVNPGDVVTLQHSADGVDWVDVQTKTTSATQSSVQFSYTLSKSESFRIKTVDDGGLESFTSTVAIDFHNIKLTVTDEEAPVTTPETTTIEINKGGCAYFYPQYTGYDITPTTVDKAKIVGSDGTQSEINITDNNKEICDIEKAVTYYVEYDGCQSNSVAVNLLGTVDIELVERDCNTAEFKAITLAQTVQWYYVDATGAQVEVGEPQPASNTFTYNITEDVAAIRASIGSGTSLVYSDDWTAQVYTLKMEGKYFDETYNEGETITVDYDDEITLYISNDSYIGDKGNAQFFTVVDTLVYAKDIQVTPVGPVAEYTFKAQKSREYYIKVNGCQTGTIKVVVRPEVSFTSKKECSHYIFTAEVKGEGTIEWYFDDLSEDPVVKIPDTDGKLEIEFDAPEDGEVIATYGVGDVSDSFREEVELHSITLDATPKQIEKGEDVIFTVTPNEEGWLTDYYTELYKVGGDKVGNPIKEPVNTWNYRPEVTASYYAKTEDGCLSNEVKIQVGSVSMSYTNKCNTYTLKAITEGEGTVVWQKNVSTSPTYADWVDISGSEGKAEYTIDITEDIIVRAKFGDFYSESNTLTYYSLTLEAEPKKIETCGDDALLTATITPSTQSVFTFFKKGESTAIYEGLENSCSTGKLYSGTTFIVKNNDCVAETTVDVDLLWPTIFMPYNSGSTNSVFEVCAKSLQIFDRTGNMVADINGNSWNGTGADGKLVMPGVYFYVATLYDDSVKKGTVEVYQDKNK
ncbi:MAG: gliding motility-associated C-terminal domain-containing protein [Paludibacteraceae bacterium]|nr:gliding motility-associated C-terminal domain-containing protein [Paludibacteraceae bacterium]